MEFLLDKKYWSVVLALLVIGFMAIGFAVYVLSLILAILGKLTLFGIIASILIPPVLLFCSWIQYKKELKSDEK